MIFYHLVFLFLLTLYKKYYIIFIEINKGVKKMADISYYWQNKPLRALQANQHTEIMARQYPEEIEDSFCK